VDPHVRDQSAWGYAGPIAISALAHAAFIYLILFALPRWFTAETAPPPAYSVNIVDNIPAGDLGTHTLPRLSGGNPPEPEKAPESEPDKEPEEPSKIEPPAPSTAIEAKNDDPNAFALNKPTATAEATPEPTATPTPEVTATAAPTPAPLVATPEPTPAPTARPTPRPRPIPKRTHRPRPTARPTPRPRHAISEPRGKHHRGPPLKPEPKVMFAHAAAPSAPAAANIRERLRKVREELLREHLRQLAQNARNHEGNGDDDSDEGATANGVRNGASGGGPVLANSAGGGKGSGIGPGGGSVGMLKDPEFLLYYQKVQERIKDAWSFYGGNRDLTTTVEFAIGPDGNVAGISVSQSSKNSPFDQSVVRAVRRAAPFPPPPEKYRDQFAQGIQAVFKLGELRS
jgi:TonB family protein